MAGASSLTLTLALSQWEKNSQTKNTPAQIPRFTRDDTLRMAGASGPTLTPPSPSGRGREAGGDKPRPYEKRTGHGRRPLRAYSTANATRASTSAGSFVMLSTIEPSKIAVPSSTLIRT
jgi:hypothetical protein